MLIGLNNAITGLTQDQLSKTINSLFSKNEQGIWYDPSDLSTLYEDAAGTIPITSPLEKPVGLMLDKSRGLVLGSELAGTKTPSTIEANWTNLGNGVYSSSGSSGYLKFNGLTAGKWYSVSYTVSTTSGSLVGYINSPWDWLPTKRYLMASSTEAFLYSASFSGTVSNISVRELPGNHAYQSTTTSRPTLSARYNLLTKTEALTDAAWTKQAGTTVNASPVADPNGALNAWFVTGNGTSGIYQAILGTVSLGQSTRSVYLRVQSGTATIGLTDPALSQGTTTCNVTTTWQRFTLTETTSPTAGYVGGLFLRNIPVGGIEVAWPDVRPTNDGIGLPAYQRVNTSTDYDYAGFPPYLKFDGTDDSMATGSIDFSGTDKMFVAAGVRKLSDAADGILVELSQTATSNAGSFVITSPFSSTNNRLGFGVNGTIRTNQITGASDYVAPISLVTACSFDISKATSAEEILPRVNGQIPTTSTSGSANAGSGNFGNYPLYIGRRGGSTVPLNGRIYSLIVCGKTASASEITSTESYINSKTRAY